MKKNRKSIAALALVLIVSAITTSAFAAETGKISGGWSESRGYYVNNYVDDGASVCADGTPTATPNSHKGERWDKVVNSGGDTASAAHGETVWFYKYHYTTARMELKNGTVKETSGRVWGDNATEATSPYYLPGLFENTEARTYWGS